MKYDVLSLGPARMDCYLHLPEDEITEVCSMDERRCMIQMGFGEKIVVSGMEFAIGGNAGNNAVGMSRLGLKSALIGPIGDSFSDGQVMETLRKEGVETKYMDVRPGERGFGVIINYQGERTILSYHSQTRCNWPTDPELESNWVYLTSMGEGYEDFYVRAVLWAKERGAKIGFNPGTRQIKVGLEPLRYAYEAAEIVFVNKEEAEEILGKEPETEVKELLSALAEIGPKVVVITDGVNGTFALFEGKYLHMPIVPATVVERTGAGDAFGSGFLAAYIHGKPVEEALRWGTVNSASVLGFVGPQAGLLTTEQVGQWLEKSAEIQPQEI